MLLHVPTLQREGRSALNNKIVQATGFISEVTAFSTLTLAVGSDELGTGHSDGTLSEISDHNTANFAT